MALSKYEQETIIRWDEEEQVAHLYTAHGATAKKWEKLGWPVKIMDKDGQGKARGWEAEGSVDCIVVRKHRQPERPAQETAPQKVTLVGQVEASK